jgi:hypothetical protein
MDEDASNTIGPIMGEAKTGRFQQSLLRWCPFSIIDHMSGKEEGSKDGIGELDYSRIVSALEKVA